MYSTRQLVSTKVPGALARTYANDTCAYLITRVALEGRVALAKMVLTDATPHIGILLYKKQRLQRKYLLQLYSNCCYTEQWQNVAISSTTWRRARSVHDVRSP